MLHAIIASMPAVSVLIPCYNVAATVDEAISRLVDQSMPDFKVEVVDDGSTDGRYSMYNDVRMKRYYLVLRRLSKCDQVILWGNGTFTATFREQLLEHGCPVAVIADSPQSVKGQAVEPSSVITPVAFHNRLKSGQQLMVLVAENDPSRRDFIYQQLVTPFAARIQLVASGINQEE